MRRNPDLFALGLLILLLALMPVAAGVAGRAMPEHQIRLIGERVRAMDECLTQRIEERINEKIREKLQRLQPLR